MAKGWFKWRHPTSTRTYFAWRNMRRRCRDPKDASYANYGGRGISVCPEWESYDVFFEDMGECPPCLTLDRIDVDGNYCADNCRWASWKVQHNNQRRNVRVSTGETMSEYCERTGESYSALAKRSSRASLYRRFVEHVAKAKAAAKPVAPKPVPAHIAKTVGPGTFEQTR